MFKEIKNDIDNHSITDMFVCVVSRNPRTK